MEPLKLDWKSSDYLNFQDLNRIEEWNGKLAKDLQSRGYDVKYKKKVSPWTVNDIPTINDLNRIRQNIENLKDGYFAIPEWRDMIFAVTHDFEQQNAMEWDLQQCYIWYERMIQIFLPSNVYQCGYTGNLRDELYYFSVVEYPSILIGTRTYNGSPQSPTFSNQDKFILSKQSERTDAGSYVVGVKPVHGLKWETGVSTVRDYPWKIEKAASSIKLTPESLTMTKNNYIETIGIEYDGDAEISVSADNDRIRIVSFDNRQVRIQSQYTGTAKVSVSAPEGKNYFAPASKTCNVNVTSIVNIDPVSGSSISGGYYYLPNGI